jgi:hypothetical protein
MCYFALCLYKERLSARAGAAREEAGARGGCTVRGVWEGLIWVWQGA